MCCDENVAGVGDNDVDDDNNTGHEETNDADLGMRWKERMGDAFDPNLVFEPLGDFQSRSLVLPHSLVNSDNKKLFHEILAKSVVGNRERVIFMMVEEMLSMMKVILMTINLTSRVAKERRTRKQSNGEGTAPRYR